MFIYAYNPQYVTTPYFSIPYFSFLLSCRVGGLVGGQVGLGGAVGVGGVLGGGGGER